MHCATNQIGTTAAARPPGQVAGRGFPKTQRSSFQPAQTDNIRRLGLGMERYFGSGMLRRWAVEPVPVPVPSAAHLAKRFVNLEATVWAFLPWSRATG